MVHHCFQIPIVEDCSIELSSLEVLFWDLLPRSIDELLFQKPLSEISCVECRFMCPIERQQLKVIFTDEHLPKIWWIVPGIIVDFIPVNFLLHADSLLYTDSSI